MLLPAFAQKKVALGDSHGQYLPWDILGVPKRTTGCVKSRGGSCYTVGFLAVPLEMNPSGVRLDQTHVFSGV